MWWQIYLPKIVRQCGQLSSSPPGSAAHLWWAMMISRVMKVDQNVKKGKLSSKNEMLIFILCSTSDDQPSNLSNESQPKCGKRPPKSSKNEMLIFGLCSTCGDLPSNLSDESQPKCKKGPLSHQKMKYSFLGYIQLLMIGWVIQVMKVNQNVKKWKNWYYVLLVLWLHRNWYTHADG